MESTFLIGVAILVIAALYSSVGHGGASGYLAVMVLFSVGPDVTRATALILNVFVASIAAIQFCRSGHFSWRTFWPFAATSVPFAYVGGMVTLPAASYKVIVGVVLIVAAARLAANVNSSAEAHQPNVFAAAAIGALIGLVSGLVGVGGGIFLTPILVLMNWSETKTAAGVSAVFILVNSVSGIAGNYSQAANLPAGVWIWIAAAVAGGFAGSTLGAKHFDTRTLRRLLALVLVFAGAKLAFV